MAAKPKKTVYVSIFAFISFSLLLWFLKGISVDATLAVPVSGGLVFSSPAEFIGAVAKCSFSCACELALIYLSGFSAFPGPVGAAVLAFRGACLGASLRAIRDGTLVFRTDKTFLGLSPAAAVTALYAAVTLLIILAVAAAANCSFTMMRREKGCAADALRYTAAFSVIFGAAVLLELLRFSVLQ